MEKRKVAVITGATRGIGNAIANRMADDGFAIVACGTMSPERADEHLKEVKEKTEMLYVRADMSKQEDRENLIASAVERFGRIDALINNAGVGSVKQENILDVSEESLNSEIDGLLHQIQDSGALARNEERWPDSNGDQDYSLFRRLAFYRFGILDYYFDGNLKEYMGLGYE